MKHIKPTLLILVFTSLLASIGCNAPPLYEKNAREFLQQQGVSAEIISRLTQRKRLVPAEVEQLAQYENIAVLHLLGANAGTPQAIINQKGQSRLKRQLNVRSIESDPFGHAVFIASLGGLIPVSYLTVASNLHNKSIKDGVRDDLGTP